MNFSNMNLTGRLSRVSDSWENDTDQGIDHYSQQGLLDSARADTIWKIFPPFLILIGTFGNILTILVLCRKAMWKMASSPYLVVLSVADITVLYSGLLRQWVYYLNGVDIRYISAVLCKLHTVLVYTATHFSVWILVTVSVERFICVCFPFKAKRICTRKRAKITMIVLLAVIFLINCHFLYGLGSVYDEQSGELISHCEYLYNDYDTFRTEVWPWIDLSMLSMIPFFIIFVCNICLITKISRSGRRKKLLSSDGAKGTRAKPSSMTALLVSLNTVFLLTTGPICVYFLVSPKWNVILSKDEEARLDLWFAIVNFLMYLNNSVNFIFYCISGTQFREELKVMFKRHNTVIPGTLTGSRPPPVNRPECEQSAPEQPSSTQVDPPQMELIPDPSFPVQTTLTMLEK